MKKIIVTGGAGFVGKNLVSRLVAEGAEVTVIDNLSTGTFGGLLSRNHGFLEEDLRAIDPMSLAKVFSGAHTVYHLAANADVRHGWDDYTRDLEQNLLVTVNVAQAARLAGVKEIIFTSTGSVYGNRSHGESHESDALQHTSLYSASKASAEAFLQAFTEAHPLRVVVFRLVSVLGPWYSHGHIFDFFNSLRENPKALSVQGDGFQSKSYLHVSDCVNGLISLRGDESFEIFNLGTPGMSTVRENLETICGELSVRPTIHFGDSRQGWIGDNPRILLSIEKARKYGWEPEWEIQAAVADTVRWLRNGTSQDK